MVTTKTNEVLTVVPPPGYTRGQPPSCLALLYSSRSGLGGKPGAGLLRDPNSPFRLEDGG